MNQMMIKSIMQMQKNPAEFLSQRGFNIPKDINSPNDIIQYLMNTGQISQQKYNMAVSLAKQYFRIW